MKKQIIKTIISYLFLSVTGCNQPASNQPNTDTGQSLNSIKTIPVGKSPHGMGAAMGFIYNSNEDDGTISIIDTSKDEVVKTIKVDGGATNYVKAFHDEKFILALDSGYGNVLVFDPAQDHKLIQTIAVGKNPDKIIISDDDKTAFVALVDENKAVALNFGSDRTKVPDKKEFIVGNMLAGTEDRDLGYGEGWLITPNTVENDVSLVNLADGKEKRLTDGNDPETVGIGLVNGKAGVALVGNKASNTITLFELNSDARKTLTDVGLSPTDTVISDKMSRAFVTMAGSNELAVIDYSAKTLIKKIPVGSRPVHVYDINALSAAKSSEIWVGNDTGDSVTVIDEESLKVKATVKVGKGHHKIAFTGTKAYVSNITDNTISVIDRKMIN